MSIKISFLRYFSLFTLLFSLIPSVCAEIQWQGQWIGIDRLLPGESMDNKTRVNARYLRKEFALKDKTVKKATAYIATMGYYELFINGQRIGNHVLTPIQTDFRKSIYYDTHDVSAALSQSAKPVIGIILGNGRTVPMRYLKHYKCPFFGFPKVLLNVIVEYSDGTKERLTTSTQWKATANGPIRSNNEYDGEVYDATKELAGWLLHDYDDTSWQAAERTELPIGALRPLDTPNQTATPLSSYGSVKAPTIIKDNIIDVQQNIAGWVSLRIKGNKGDTIRIKYAERLNPDSTLYIANLRDAETEDVYICNGMEGNDFWWHPTFVYHGFRYVQVKGMAQVSVDDIKPYVVANEIATIGTFTSSNKTLNTILRNAWWGILDNYKGYPVDCPQRNERQPWLGDRTAGSLGESYLFDNNTLYTHWMRDICDAQRYDGSIPDVAPAFWNYYSDIVTWPAALPFTCEMLYEQFGNDEAIRSSYPYIKKWITHMCECYMKDGIITKDKYGDWCMPPEKPELIHSEDPARQTDGALLSTAYMIHILEQMAQFASIQGFTAEEENYTRQANAMKEAFNRKFLTVKRGTSPEPGHPLFPDSIYYGNNTATANVLALAFGIVPDDCRKAVVDNVVKNIVTDNNGHVSCGVIGISHLLRTLTANGYGDVAYLIATNTTYPSWGYMAEHGATTIWELWNGDTADPAMNSSNHVMLLGDLIAWCYQDLAGIKNAPASYVKGKKKPASVGYKHLLMKPDFSIQDLDSINASYRTPQGIVTSSWKKDLETLHWEITLPDGVTADAVMPDGTVRSIKGGVSVFDVPMPLGTHVTESQFVYDHSQYPETHSASIVELSDGTLLATYFGGTKERNPDVCIYTQCKEQTWSAPVLAADGVFPSEPIAGTKSDVIEKYVPASFGPQKKLGTQYSNGASSSLSLGEGGGRGIRTACWNPVLFQMPAAPSQRGRTGGEAPMPDGEVWLFFKIGRNVKDWTGWVCKSLDGGKTWSEKEMLPEGFLGPIKNKPLLIDNKLICPSSTEENGWQLHFEILDLATGQWTKSLPKNSPDVLAIQPSILNHGNGLLQVVARTRPTKAQREGTDNTRGRIATCWSRDNGMTWGETSLLDFPNNQSGIDAVTLSKPRKVKCSDGRTYTARHVLIYNNFGTLPGTTKGPRTPLSLAVSEDGITWHHFLTLEDSPISQYSYPAIIEGKDGSLHCIYTWRRQRIAYKKVIL